MKRNLLIGIVILVIIASAGVLGYVLGKPEEKITTTTIAMETTTVAATLPTEAPEPSQDEYNSIPETPPETAEVVSKEIVTSAPAETEYPHKDVMHTLFLNDILMAVEEQFGESGYLLLEELDTQLRANYDTSNVAQYPCIDVVGSDGVVQMVFKLDGNTVYIAIKEDGVSFYTDNSKPFVPEHGNDTSNRD